MKAVITGDIINSSEYSSEDRGLVISALESAAGYLKSRDSCRYTIYRGDSVQALLDDPGHALWHTAYLKSTLKALKRAEKDRSSMADIRIAIGLGEVSFLKDKLEVSTGEAFEYSGRALDKMKSSGSRMAIKSGNPVFDDQWNTILGLTDVVMDKWSVSSAEVVRELLTGRSEKEISQKLKISPPAVSQRKKYAGWNALKGALALFETQACLSLPAHE